MFCKGPRIVYFKGIRRQTNTICMALMLIHCRSNGIHGKNDMICIELFICMDLMLIHYRNIGLYSKNNTI